MYRPIDDRGDRLARAGGAAGDRPDPGEQFVDAERLGDVVVGAGVERVHLVLAAGPAGQHDDRDVGPAAQAADDVDAVHVGQAEVEHDQVRVLAGGQRAARRPPSAATVDVVAPGAQVDPQRAQDLRLVVDDQDPGHDSPPADSVMRCLLRPPAG